MKVLFAGTPDFAVPSLEALIHAGHEIVAVLTQPDRRQGRGQHTHYSPVKSCALAHKLPVLQPPSLKTPQGLATLTNLHYDLMVVVAYGLILPKNVLTLPSSGLCINVHASLLPRWRGAAPIQHALLAGDTQTGVTIMCMDEGMDTGPIISQKSCPIKAEDTNVTLHHTLAHLGATALVDTLTSWPNITHTPQDKQGIKYAPKINKEDSLIDWDQPASRIVSHIQAMHPWPGTFMQYNAQRIRILAASAEAHPTTAKPGTLIETEKRLRIACQDSVLQIHELQVPGKKAMSWEAFYCGHADFFSH